MQCVSFNSDIHLLICTDTLGVLARTIGDDNFRPMASESIDLGIQLMKANDDPDLRKATYGLFASIASVLKEDMASVLPTIVEPMVNSVKSGGGIVVSSYIYI